MDTIKFVKLERAKGVGNAQQIHNDNVETCLSLLTEKEMRRVKLSSAVEKYLNGYLDTHYRNIVKMYVDRGIMSLPEAVAVSDVRREKDALDMVRFLSRSVHDALGEMRDEAINDGTAVAMLMNPLRRARAFQLPLGDWRVRINTSAAMPEDIVDLDAAPRPRDDTVMVPSKSMIVLTDTE